MSRFWRLVLAGLMACHPQASWSDATAERLARGKYLMDSVVACGNCHVQRGPQGEPLFERGLSGGFKFDGPPFTAYAANITPDVETGIGRWTEAQLIKAIREGLRPDGSLIGPPMPIEFYRHLSDDDVAALVAYLRAQPPVANAVPKSVYRMPLPPSYGPPLKQVKAPPAKDLRRHGQYLVEIAHCMECHTPRDEKGQLIMSRLGAGGETFKGPWGVSVSRNLTPDESGLKHWTDAQIAQTIRTGIRPDGQALKPPMGFGFYSKINDADMKAIVAYLRSLKPQKP